MVQFIYVFFSFESSTLLHMASTNFTSATQTVSAGSNFPSPTASSLRSPVHSSFVLSNPDSLIPSTSVIALASSALPVVFPTPAITTATTVYESQSTSVPFSSQPNFPHAAIFTMLLALFVAGLSLLLVLRTLLKRKGLCGGVYLPECCMCRGTTPTPSCRQQLLKLAEAVDCNVPSCQVWLDNTCPSQQRCWAACSKLWSCYCCVVLPVACEELCRCHCPGCEDADCPDWRCCGDCCHCSLRVPECSHITCLCFECGRPNTLDSTSHI